MAFSWRQALRSAAVSVVLARERWQAGVAYNPFSPAMARDPYPTYARLRTEDPVHRSRLLDAWVFSRHADVDAVLRDHRRFSSDLARRKLSPRQRASLPQPDDVTMLFLDPPEHTRLKNSLSGLEVSNWLVT